MAFLLSVYVNDFSMVSIRNSVIHYLLFFALTACNKSAHQAAITIATPNDPPFSGTVGFFGSDWTGKTFTVPSFTMVAKPSGVPDATVQVDMSNVITRVSKYLFGNNTNMWTGQMSNQASLIGYIKDLSPNILRAPGGSASDIYFWNALFGHLPSDVTATLFDGNGNPVPTDSTSYWYGKNTPSWSLSIDDYYSALQMTNTSTGIITVNYAYARYGTGANPVSAAAHLAADWVRYDNGRTKYWEVGNECYGTWEACYKIDTTKNQDGQPAIITGNLYGQHFKIFSDSMKAAATEIGKTIYVGAVILDQPPQPWETPTTQTWNTEVLSTAGAVADFFIIHDYFTAYNTNSNVNDILNSATSVPASAMGYVKSQLQQSGLGLKPVALSEWNIEAVGSRQNTSYIAGVHAVITLGELIKNEFGEASRWDIANGWSNGDDMGLFNIGDEPAVPKWSPRPAFFYLYYFWKYFGDRMVSSVVSDDANILSYASSFSSGASGVVLVNKNTTAKTVQLIINNFRPGTNYYWYTLTGGTDNGDFSGSVYVNGNAPSGAGGPLNYPSIKANAAPQAAGIAISVPGRSVVFLIAESK